MEQVPRITINTTVDGIVELWFNEAGREKFINELLNLDSRDDHFHIGVEMDVEASPIGYRTTDTVYEWGKVYFRLDEWDEKAFPHVIAKP
jgi:hypothetical protein